MSTSRNKGWFFQWAPFPYLKSHALCDLLYLENSWGASWSLLRPWDLVKLRKRGRLKKTPLNLSASCPLTCLPTCRAWWGLCCEGQAEPAGGEAEGGDGGQQGDQVSHSHSHPPHIHNIPPGVSRRRRGEGRRNPPSVPRAPRTSMSDEGCLVHNYRNISILSHPFSVAKNSFG